MKLGGTEVQVVLSLIRELTGHQFSEDNSVCILQNLESRMLHLKMDSVSEYFRRLERDPSELEAFIAFSTVHTTSWFRDSDQIRSLEEWIVKELESGKKSFRIWSAACSTGQEAFSLALVFESLKSRGWDVEYTLVGTDLDRLSLLTAAKAEYPLRQLTEIPEKYRSYVESTANLQGTFFGPNAAIRERTQFVHANLLGDLSALGHFDIILLRNILFYFDLEAQKKVIHSVESHVAEEGLLCLGASDLSDHSYFSLKSLGKAFFVREKKRLRKVLIIDDSEMAQFRLREIFLAAGFAVDTAICLSEAEAKLKSQEFCAITLDVNLESENGLDWLAKKRRQHSPMVQRPVVIVSDLGQDQLDEGYEVIVAECAAYFEKSQLRSNGADLISTVEALLSKPARVTPVRSAVKLQSIPQRKIQTKCSLILIGASTGGPRAVTDLLENMPSDAPPIVVVQHLDSQFQESFRSRLCLKSGLQNGNLSENKVLRAGNIYVPLSGEHIGIERSNGQWCLKTISAPPVHRCRPAIDVLFSSILDAHEEVIGILMTGMGRDGARGLKSLHTNGSITFIQDEASSVVWGMPGEAARLEAGDFTGSPQDIRAQILALLAFHSKSVSGF